MASISPEIATLKGRLGGIVLQYGPDSPEAEEARQELAEAIRLLRIRRLVDSARPLSPETHARLAAIVGTAAKGGGPDA